MTGVCVSGGERSLKLAKFTARECISREIFAVGEGHVLGLGRLSCRETEREPVNTGWHRTTTEEKREEPYKKGVNG